MKKTSVTVPSSVDIFRLGNGADFFDGSAPGFSSGDSVFGGNGKDRIEVSADDLTLSGENGNDMILLRGDRGILLGGNGDDALSATGRGSTLDGGRGMDVITSDSSTSSYYDYGTGNLLVGGQGVDSFVIYNQSDLIVNNNTGSGSEVVDAGDQIEGLFDVITDYSAGESIAIEADSFVSGTIGLDAFSAGHQHLGLDDGDYAILAGSIVANGTFNVGDGSDCLIVWDNKNGVDEPYFQGALAVAGVSPGQLNIMTL